MQEINLTSEEQEVSIPNDTTRHDTTRHLIMRCGVDLTSSGSDLMDLQSCMCVRYDTGIAKHRREHTGVIEIWRIDQNDLDN